MQPDIVLTDAPTSTTWRSIVSGLSAFNEHHAGPENFRLLVLMLQDQHSGETIGGLWGRTLFEWLYVNILFVPEALRGSGLGTTLMRRAEDEARDRGCRGALVDTFSFQARPFYERLGYRVIGTVADYPPGHACFFLSRRLDDRLSKRQVGALPQTPPGAEPLDLIP